jgi:predicted lipoprotein with Yx(FWY)xxD motif
MRIRNRVAAGMLAGAMMLSAAVPAFAADAPASPTIKSDAQVAADLGVLQGDGNGVNDAYLAKTTTRLQAAILFLRLKGLEQTAAAFDGKDNFSDAKLVSDSNQKVLAYLKANASLGWTGTGDGKFDPMSNITAQQYYKVLLEALGYKQDTDFTYDNVIAFAKSQGMSQVAKAGSLRNGHIATATVEALRVKAKGGMKTLADVLVDAKVIDTGKVAAAKYSRINISSTAELGSFLTDENGRTLYTYTKDMPGMSMCVDQCAVNWPIYSADNLQLSAELNAADFSSITRADGKKQVAYKGMPLYYFAKDAKAGDVTGQAVNNVWYVAGHSGVGVATNEKLGSYLVDAKGMALYLYTRDTENSTVCYGNCEVNWPIFYSANISDTAELKAADFGTITRTDGTMQTTFRGAPLYYYVKDMKAGDVTGQDVGKVWYVIDPAPPAAPTEEAPAAAESGYKMDIVNFAFAQKEITIEVGSTITFTNRDRIAEHNVVSDELVDGKPLFETPLLGLNESFTLKFDKAGEYTYFCEPHKDFMTGKITVK